MKEYANAIIAIVVLILICGLLGERWYYGEQRFKAGKDEVQALWDADKATRKAVADKQAAETLKFNQEHQDALSRTTTDLRNSRSNLAIALERLRDLPAVSGGEGLPVADSGSASVPGVADHLGSIGIRVEQRIGSCEDSGSEPCYVSRAFFGQAMNDAQDRGITRQWAAGQGIKAVGVDK